MAFRKEEYDELEGCLAKMSKKKDVVGEKGTLGDLTYHGIFGWLMTGEPIFTHQDTGRWMDYQGRDFDGHDLMFIVFGFKRPDRIFMKRMYDDRIYTDRYIFFENLNDAATDLGVKVMIDPVSLWLYIDDSVAADTSSIVLQPPGSVKGQMPLSKTESDDLRECLKSMSSKKDIVHLRGNAIYQVSVSQGRLAIRHNCMLYGWRITGEPIFKPVFAPGCFDYLGRPVKDEDVNMFIVFGHIRKGSESVFVNKYDNFTFLRDRVIFYQNLNDVARVLGLKVMLDPVSLWLYIDDSVVDTSTVQQPGTSIVPPGVKQQLVASLQQIRDALEDLKNKCNNGGCPSTVLPQPTTSGLDIDLGRIKLRIEVDGK